MNQSAFQAITAMTNAFPQSATDKKALLLTYEKALTGIGDTAITEAAMRFTMGEVQGQSKTFAPSVAEFVTEARQRQEYIDLKAKPRLPSPSHYTGTPWHVRQEKARTQYRHCPIIKENVSYDEWRKLSAAREVPVGSVWVATVATIYGPPAAEIALRS